MTTRRQIEANRRNARKSTGPRSPKGRTRAAQNARKHGLTASPDWAAVVRWYKIIIEDIEALPDPLSRDASQRAALQLAIAEAQLERARQAEEEHLVHMHERALKGERHTELEIAVAEMEVLEAEVVASWMGRQPLIAHHLELNAALKKVARLINRSDPNRPAALKQKGATLSRYRRQAEARRHKALDHWISVAAK